MSLHPAHLYRLLGLALVIALLNFSCESASPPLEQKSKQQISLPSNRDVEPPKEMTISVIDSGAEEKQMISFYPSREVEQHFVLTLKMQAQLAPASGLTIPVLSIAGHVKVSPLDLSHWRYQFYIDQVKLEASDHPELQDALKSLEQVVLTKVWDGKRERPFKIQAQTLNAKEKALLEQIQRGLTEIWIPIPEQPLGIGAQWTVQRSIQTPMLTFVRHSTYTLQDMDEHHLTVQVESEITAPFQQVTQKGARRPIRMNLVGFSGTEKAQWIIDNALPIPTVESNSHLIMAFQTLDGEQNIQTQTHVNLKLQPTTP